MRTVFMYIVDVFGQCQWYLHCPRCPRYPDRSPVSEDWGEVLIIWTGVLLTRTGGSPR